MTTQSLAVLPARVVFEAIQLQDDRILAVEVDQPPIVFVVAHRAGNEVEILSKHETAEEAEQECRRLAGQIERLAEGHAGRLN